MVLETVAVALWAMLPAYLPNNVAVLVGGGRPIDGGRTLGERRVLGDGKTWRGTAAGIAAGAVLALGVLDPAAAVVGGALGIDLPGFPVAAAVALPAGAMVGDVAASFLKRRTGRQRGAPLPGVDQLDFVVGALVVAAVAAPAWFGATFALPVIAVVFAVTPVLHVATNAGAYLLGLKDEPW